MRRSKSSSNIPIRSRRGFSSIDRSKQSTAPQATPKPSNQTPLTSRRIISSVTSATSTGKRANVKSDIAAHQDVVYRFFAERFNENCGPQHLKSLTIKSFVEALQIIFRDIDPRILITVANHKEVTMKYLTLWRYPEHVPMSVLKYANVPQSLKQIMKILSWLIKYSETFRKPSEGESDKICAFLRGGVMSTLRSEAPMQKSLPILFETVNFSDQEYEAKQTVVSRLIHELNVAKNRRDSLKKKNEELEKKLDEMRHIIEAVASGQLFDRTDNNIACLEKRRCDLLTATENQTALLKTLRDVISNQKYSLIYKKEIEASLEERKYSSNLRAEFLEKLKNFVNENALKMSEFRRQVESSVMEVNLSLLQINLVPLIPNAEKIRINTNNFEEPQFRKEVEDLLEELKHFGHTIESISVEIEEKLLKAKHEIEEYKCILEKQLMEIAKLKKLIGELKEEMKKISCEKAVLERNFEKNREKLNKAVCESANLKKEEEELLAKLKQEEEEQNANSDKIVEFFEKLMGEMKERDKQMRMYIHSHMEEQLRVRREKVEKEEKIAEEMLKIMRENPLDG